MEIPVVDFSAYELEKTSVTVDNLKKLSDELRKAFTEVGFVYLKNTGINQDEVCHFFTRLLQRRLLLVSSWLFCPLFQVDKVMGVSKKFFCLPESMKKPFSRGRFSCDGNHGWISVETERHVRFLLQKHCCLKFTSDAWRNISMVLYPVISQFESSTSR